MLTRDRIPPDEVVLVQGVRCAIGERALFDEIRRLDRFEDQVVAADMAFGGELTSIRRMRRYRWSRYWYRDVRRLDRVLPFASEHARSRPEVDFRLLELLDELLPVADRQAHFDPAVLSAKVGQHARQEVRCRADHPDVDPADLLDRLDRAQPDVRGCGDRRGDDVQSELCRTRT